MTQRDEAERLATEIEADTEHLTISRSEIAALLRKQAAEIERLQDYDTRLTAVMPAGFKDWHQNSKAEWPEIAAGVITNQREHINYYIEDLNRKDAEIERKDILLREALTALSLCRFDSLNMSFDHLRRAQDVYANIKTELGE